MAHTPGERPTPSINSTSWADLVREYFPDASEDECNFLLCERTAFPLAPIETIRKQLGEERVRAAAPDLLGALEDLLSSAEHYTKMSDSAREGYEFDEDDMQAARAAIAKAKGE